MAAYMRRSCRLHAVIYTNSPFMYYIRRTVATKSKKLNQIRPTSSYKELVNFRREQSDRSLLVSIIGHHGDVYKVCQKHGQVSAVFPFSNNQKEYVLIEMESRSALRSVLNVAQQFPNRDKIPVHTRFLYMQRAQGQSSPSHCPNSLLHKTRPPPDDAALLDSLRKCRSVHDQLIHLHRATTMSELATRLRFLLCSSLEETLRGTLPTCVVEPFGSSVNGFGKHDCDLDMILEMDEEKQVQGRLRKEGLYFMSKKKQDNNRLQTQMTLDTIGGIISHFTPQFGYVRRILKARIPIVKFVHRGTGVECDLSIGNRSAVYMSELLHLYGELDPRVRPLVYAVRTWARVQDVTRSDPGPWLSNFMITWMVIFYLQGRGPPVVPSIGQLRNMAAPSDKKVLDGEDMTFITDWTRVAVTENKESLDELLHGFFKVYTDMDFNKDAISLVKGQTFPKPDPDVPLHLENPLECDLNASRNVSADELAKFQISCSRAATALRRGSGSRSTGSGGNWGLLAILGETDNTVNNETNLKVSVAGLFSDDSGPDGRNSKSGEAKPTNSLDDEAKPMSSSDNEAKPMSSSDDDLNSLDEEDISTPLTGTYNENFNQSEGDSDSLKEPSSDADAAERESPSR